MKVKCKEEIGFLTKYEVYEVLEEDSQGYLINDDIGYDQWYSKERFEVVEEKESVDMCKARELSLVEVLNIVKDRQVWESKWKRIYINPDGHIEIVYRDDGCASAMIFPEYEKFTLRAEMVTFEEALKAYEQGIEVMSCYKGCKFVKRNGKDWYKEVEDIDWNSWSVEKGGFTFEEIRNLWYINN